MFSPLNVNKNIQLYVKFVFIYSLFLIWNLWMKYRILELTMESCSSHVLVIIQCMCCIILENWYNCLLIVMVCRDKLYTEWSWYSNHLRRPPGACSMPGVVGWWGARKERERGRQCCGRGGRQGAPILQSRRILKVQILFLFSAKQKRCG